jgi:hypothetical protein
MDKNINYMIEKCRPFWCNRTLPQVYDDSLSFEELLYHIFAKINECIDTVNSWSEMAKKLESILNDIDATLKKEIIAILKKWYEDGTLKEIIKSTLADYVSKNGQALMAMATKSKVLDMKRVWRITRTMQDGNSKSVEQEHYSYCQGACKFLRNGKTYFAFYLICQNNSNIYTRNDNGELAIYNLTDGKFVMSDNFSFGHGNDICYNPDENALYVAYSSEWKNSNTRSPSANVAKVQLSSDMNSMRVSDTKNFSKYLEAVSSVSYDATDKSMYIGEGFDIYKITNWASATATPFLNLQNAVDGYAKGSRFLTRGATVQTNAVCGNYAYFLRYKPNSLIRYNIKAGMFDMTYSIPTVMSNGMYRVGECEAFTIDTNGDFWLIDTQHLMYKPVNALDMTQVFVDNLWNFQAQGTVNPVAYDQTTKTLYVDGSKNYGYNPDGTSDYPFSSLPEAVVFCKTSDWTRGKTCYIKLKSNSIYPIFYTGGDTTLVLQEEDPSNLKGYYIGNVFADGSKIVIDSLHIKNVVPYDISDKQYRNSEGKLVDYISEIWKYSVMAGRAADITIQSDTYFSREDKAGLAKYHVHLNRCTWRNPGTIKAGKPIFYAENSICKTAGWVTADPDLCPSSNLMN